MGFAILGFGNVMMELGNVYTNLQDNGFYLQGNTRWNILI